MLKDCCEDGCDCGWDMVISLAAASKLVLRPVMARLGGGTEEKDL
jgi:hypothetical protein